MGLRCKNGFIFIKSKAHSVYLFIYLLEFVFVASINTMLIPVSTSAHKNRVRIGENTENNQTIASSHRSNITDATLFT